MVGSGAKRRTSFPAVPEAIAAASVGSIVCSVCLSVAGDDSE